MRKRGRPTKEDTRKKRITQPLCTCDVQHTGVGEDHVKDCPLYRQRGSGVSVLYGPQEQKRFNWW